MTDFEMNISLVIMATAASILIIIMVYDSEY